MIFDMRAKEVLGVIESDNAALQGSYESTLKINKIGGVCEQGENPTPTNPQEIKKSVVSEVKTHGKQFYDVNTYPLMDGYVDATSGKHASNESYLCTQYIPCEAWQGMTLTLNKRPGGSKPGIAFYSDESATSYISGEKNNSATAEKPITFTVPIGTKYLRFTVPAEATEIMLNQGTTALPYESYTESVITLSQPVELYGIGDVQDTIEGGKVKRRFAKLVYDGEENWKTSSALAGRYYVEGSGATSESNALCSCAKFLYLYSSSSVNECFFSTSVSGRFIVNTDFETVEEWKAHLASNPMTVVYEMAEETTEDLSLSDQIALNSLQTFHGFTHVEFAGDVQPTLNSDYATNLVGAVALAVHAYNEIEKRFVTFNAEDGSANFSGNIVNNAYIVGNNLQANQMVFAQAVQASIQLISKGSITADTNIEAKGNIIAVNTIEAKGDLKGKDLYITNIGIGDGAPQPVEWVWDNVLARWVLCSIPLE